MTGEKRTETRMRCYNTLCIPYISLHPDPSLHACIVYDCREGHGVIYREYTECYSISFLFLFFFHQSSLYPIKIFAKCFYLLVIIMIHVESHPSATHCAGKSDKWAFTVYRMYKTMTSIFFATSKLIYVI